MKSVLLHIKWLLINVVSRIIVFFIRRDKKVWLLGSWMGQRYADNSRYLFEYLSQNKEKYGIKKVIWVTRKDTIENELRELGLEVYPMKSLKGIYYHFKAGVHVICNMYDNVGGYNGDIYGRFSIGAVKIQLWHGLGVKAVGNMRNINKNNHMDSGIKRVVRKFFARPIFSPGGWKKCYWLVTSEEGKRIALEDLNADKNRIIMANYPRFCTKDIYLSVEKEAIKNIQLYKEKGYTILAYFPTFRNNYDEFIHPLMIKGFIDNLEDKKILWLEKKHYASTFDMSKLELNKNVLFLDTSLDVNSILKYVDIVISDYSSVITDAVIENIKTINYVPDFGDYKDNDRGFVGDYKKFNPGYLVKNCDELISVINNSMKNYFDEDMNSAYSDAKQMYMDNHPLDMGWIIDQIIDEIKTD